MLFNVKCDLICAQILSETFLIPKRTERGRTKNVCWSSCKVLVIVVGF